ncbi:glutamate receptor ionotropic, kainate glr-3-like [Colletes latitarsis]|uniref:glutamate receptor ionotropic, kainate glr-3-like n=1 Tax=Colletes latitarsis TaxID=2605962 RepID=UPI0040353FDB
MLADHLKFTLLPVRHDKNDFGMRLDNGSYNGLMGLIDRNETQVILRTGYYADRMDLLEYTTPVWRTKYRLYIQPELKHDNKWIFTIFERHVWYALVLLILILSLGGYILQTKQYRNSKKNKTRKQKTKYFTFNDHVFYTHSIMCGQGYVPDALYDQNKILSISKSTFAWLILLSFSSNLIYQMANRIVTLPFNNLDTLINKTKYDVLVFRGSMIYEFVEKRVHLSKRLPKRYDLTNRFQIVDTTSTMYRKVCDKKKKFAMLENQDKYYIKRRRICPVIPVGKSYFHTWIGFGLTKRFPYKKIINISLLKFHEVGLIDALKDRWFVYKIKYENKIPFKTIDMEQVYLILCIPCIGTAMSLVILLLENIVFYCQNKRK